jgi:hypothetical protein
MTLGLLYLYGGIKILNGDNFTIFEDLMFSWCCSSITPDHADKFNEMQLGMIAANRVLLYWYRRPDSKEPLKTQLTFIKDFKTYILMKRL